MTAFAVDLAELQEIVEELAQFAAVLHGAADDLDARARRVRGMWSGAAADAYASAHARWVDGAREMHTALGSLRSVAATAHANYSSAVAANRAMWPS